MLSPIPQLGGENKIAKLKLPDKEHKLRKTFHLGKTTTPCQWSTRRWSGLDLSQDHAYIWSAYQWGCPSQAFPTSTPGITHTLSAFRDAPEACSDIQRL